MFIIHFDFYKTLTGIIYIVEYNTCDINIECQYPP